MRLKIALALALVLALPAAARAQELKYEKYKLENGLTVILHEDHSLPVVAVNIWYRVGSKDEPEKRSGFAHLFEHLMFMGTKRVPDSDFDKLMEAGGGNNNATTSNDRTNYYSTGPAKLLPTLLWLDADRLEDLGHSMEQKKLDRQREVVRNERRQTSENKPYGKAELLVEELMYPAPHPYHMPVIGTHEDLEAAQVQDVKDFFANYYVPNNASLVVAGDFDSKKVKDLVQKLFGSIARGAEAAHRTAPAPKLGRVVRMSTLDKVQLPMITFAYNSPAQFAAGDAEMDLAANALSSGNTSRLYKRLVYDEKLAVSVNAYQSSAQLASLFKIDVTVQPGTDLDKVEKIVDEEVARFLEGGPTEAELARGKASFEHAQLSHLEGIENKADKLNEYEYFFGEPNSIARDLERYRKATREGVRDQARAVLTRDSRLILRVLPDESASAPSARDERPQDGAASAWKPAEPESFALANGVQVKLWRKDELPLVSLEVLFAGATDQDGKHPGLAALTAELMEEGAGDLDALQLADALQALGADLDTHAGHEQASLSLSVLRRNLPRAVELAADVLRRPRFEAKELERVKELHLAKLAEDDDEPTTVADRVAAKLLYGAGTFSCPSSG
ncbi:MAG: M16 family metallopeptidase, partial [Planctomycetota bacterium]